MFNNLQGHFNQVWACRRAKGWIKTNKMLNNIVNKKENLFICLTDNLEQLEIR